MCAMSQKPVQQTDRGDEGADGADHPQGLPVHGPGHFQFNPFHVGAGFFNLQPNLLDFLA